MIHNRKSGIRKYAALASDSPAPLQVPLLRAYTALAPKESLLCKRVLVLLILVLYNADGYAFECRDAF